MLLHEGVWTGTYRYVDLDGVTTEFHQSRVECVFPETGPYVYVQKNQFKWDDGRERAVEFGGILQGDRIYWDTDAFEGYGWTTKEGVVMLTLNRKDVPDTYFTEAIILGSNNISRARTWHWFKDGELYQRTLCNEHRAI